MLDDVDVVLFPLLQWILKTTRSTINIIPQSKQIPVSNLFSLFCPLTWYVGTRLSLFTFYTLSIYVILAIMEEEIFLIFLARSFIFWGYCWNLRLSFFLLQFGIGTYILILPQAWPFILSLPRSFLAPSSMTLNIIANNELSGYVQYDPW